MSVTNTSSASDRTVLPNTARLIALLMAGQGVEDADERVLHQLMDFSYRYTTDLLTDAKSFATHAGRTGTVETSDIEMAIQTRSGYEFTEGAPKDFLLPLAKQLNKIPLPTLSQAYTHILLPPPSQMLGNVNFNLVPSRPVTGEGLYESYNDDDDESGWGSADEGELQEDDQAEKGEGMEERDEPVPPGVLGTVGEEDADDVVDEVEENDGMDVEEGTNGEPSRGVKRELDDPEDA